MAQLQYDNIWKLIRNNDFDCQVDEELTCSICHNIIINACINGCGCRYCFACIKSYLNEEEKYCPNLMDDCKVQMINLENDIQIDYMTNKKVSQLKLKCPEQFCDFVDELKNMEDHINSHQIKCPYLDVGCNQPKINTDTMKNHLASECYAHSKLVLNFFHNLKNEIASVKETTEKKERKIEEMHNRINELERAGVVKKNNIIKLKQKIAMYEMKNDKVKQKLENTTKSINDLQEDSKRHQLVISEKIVDIEQRVGKMMPTEEEEKATKIDSNEELTVLRSNTTVWDLTIMNGVPFRWELIDLTHQRSEAKLGKNTIVLSEPVYTESGYLLSLVIYPNGIGQGENTHLSVGFVVCKGKNDETLQWPMRDTMTISLMDQDLNVPYVSVQYDYDTLSAVNQTRLMRPTNTKNTPIGKPKFIDYSTLLQKRSLYRNDYFLLTFCVDNEISEEKVQKQLIKTMCMAARNINH